MKLTKSQLKQIIKEEMQHLHEIEPLSMFFAAMAGLQISALDSIIRQAEKLKREKEESTQFNIEREKEIKARIAADREEARQMAAAEEEELYT